MGDVTPVLRHWYECPVCGRVLPAHSGDSPSVRYCDRASADPQHTGPTEMDREVGPLLAARLKAEVENPRPESLRRIERTIVRALVAEGFGRQYQVTRRDGFEIAVDDLVIRVEHDPTAEPDAR